MKSDKLLTKVASSIPDGETALAATKATPRGSVHEVILGAAGAVAGGTAAPGLAGAGAVAGSAAGEGVGAAGRAERADADLDVGSASQVLLVATDRSVLVFALGALGRPKGEPARLGRDRIAEVREGETSIFGQKMREIVLVTDTGAEAGFGIAKVHRRLGDEVLAALR
jgi:hypothetical protein